ncbi:MAG: glycerate kinase, partial [Duodenibacillus sp.]|nr:glycerate kinase [Duodenibacillus sp.]
MPVVVAVDSFKGCLSSLAAGEAAARGARRALPGCEALVLPLADGGEGTAAALAAGLGGETVALEVSGPLGDPVAARYAWIEGQRLAVIEMAEACGLPLAPAERRDPMAATSYGLGQMIAHALGRGACRLLVGIGGSATNDGGAGMLEALGFALVDARGRPVARGAQGLRELAAIDPRGALPGIGRCRIEVACDVAAPLCGPRGASLVFGPQKGASPATARELDSLLERFSELVRRDVCPQARPSAPGSGA